MTDPTLTPREKLTALLALAATTSDLDLRLAAVGAAKQVLAGLEQEARSLRIAVDAAEIEAARLVKLASGGKR
jgi:hypothetical protein